MSLRADWPLKLVIGGEDCTELVGEGATFSSVDPGGFEAASFPVPRDMPQIVVGQHVRFDCGLRVAWEGRVSEVQRSLGNRTLITCQGYGAKLKDVELQEIFVARDLTEWGSTPVERQIALVKENLSPQGSTIGPELASESVALVTGIQGNWSTEGLPFIEGWFDPRGIPVGSVYYAWEKGTNVNAADENWAWAVEAFNAAVTKATGTGNMKAAGPGKGTLTPAGENDAYVGVNLAHYTASGGVANVMYAVYWTALAVYGKHGLTGRGSDPKGFYPSDIAKWVAEQIPGIQLGICPDASQYTVPHSVYLTPVAAEQIVKDMGVLAGWHWGVWEAESYLTGSPTPRFDFRPYPEAGTWTASCARQDCDTLDLNENLDKLYDEAIVAYTNIGGEERSVTVTRPNPYLERVKLKRCLTLNIGAAERAAAGVFGEIALAVYEQQARVAGQAVITGLIEGHTGKQPPFLLRAGLDRLRITDLPGSDAFGSENDVAVTRVETTLSSEGWSTSLELGTGANLMETITARLESTGIVAGVQ